MEVRREEGVTTAMKSKSTNLPNWKTAVGALLATVALGASTSCESWEDTGKTKKSAIIGGAGGAAIGAAVAKDNRVAGALIGGAVGAGGGYLFGKNRNRQDR